MRTEKGISFVLAVVMIVGLVASLSGVSYLATKSATAEPGSSVVKPVAPKIGSGISVVPTANPVVSKIAPGIEGADPDDIAVNAVPSAPERAPLSPQGPVTKKIIISADAFIIEEAPDYNQGGAKSVYVGTENYNNLMENVRGIWKIDLASVIPSFVAAENISMARFSAFTYYGGEGGVYPNYVDKYLWVNCAGLDGDSWTEMGVTWNNAPAEARTHPPGVPVLDNEYVTPLNSVRYSWDVLSFVRDQWVNDPAKLATILCWWPQEGSSDNFVPFTAKEDASHWVGQESYIEVTYEVPPYAVMVNISPKYEAAPKEGKLYYTVTVQNVGANIDNYTLLPWNDLSWDMELANDRLLNVTSDQIRTTTLTVNIPSDAVLGTVDPMTVTATGDATGVTNIGTCEGRVGDELTPPTADAMVTQQYPTTNYGSAADLNGIGTYQANLLYAYLKFNLTSLPAGYSYNSAKLYLQCWDTFFAAGTPQWIDMAVCEVATDTWTESAITWNNKPENGNVIDTQRIDTSDEHAWIIWDVKAYVDSAIAAHKDNITFCVRGVVGTLLSHSASFRSKEYDNSYYWPRLDFGEGVQVTVDPGRKYVLGGSDPHFTVTIKNTGGSTDNYNLSIEEMPVWGAQLNNYRVEGLGAGASVTRDLWVTCLSPPGTDHITVVATSDSGLARDEGMGVVYLTENALSPDADVSVASGSAIPDALDTGYSVQSWTLESYKNERIFIKYDLRGIPAENYVKSAKLYFWCYSAFRDDIDAQACAVANDSWTEGTINWNNQPAYGDVIGETTLWSWRPDAVNGIENTWVAWDVTSYVAGQRRYGDNIASFCIKAAVENTSGGYMFDSKEYYQDNAHPYLYVVLGPSQPAVSVSISPVHRVGDPAANVTYGVKVMNTGNVVDTYNLVSAGGTLDSSGPFTINPGESSSTTLRVTLSGIEGAENTITVTATGALASDIETCTASVRRHGGWEVAGYAPRIDNYGVAATSAGGYIYVANSDSYGVRANFMRYDPNTGKWDSLATPDGVLYPGNPSPFKNGAYLAWDNGDYIYALVGGSYTDVGASARYDFCRYQISTNTWATLAPTPAAQGAGDALAVVGGYVYAIVGQKQIGSSFWRYNIASPGWGSLRLDWASTDDGCSLVYTGGNYLYALRGEWQETTPCKTFARYSIPPDNSWTQLADIPEEGGVGDGASLVWLGGNEIYATGGGQVIEQGAPYKGEDDNFYSYSISGLGWTHLEDLPARIGNQNGQRLGVVGDNIYCWRGCEADPVLWVYTPTTAPIVNLPWVQTWTAQTGTGSEDWTLGIAVDDSNGDIYTAGGTWTGAPASGLTSFLLLKYDKNGNLQPGWPKTWGTGGGQYEHAFGRDVAVGSDAVYIVGSKYTSANGYQGVIVKYLKDGTFVWVKEFGGTGFMDGFEDVEVGPDGSIYVAGMSSTNGGDAVILKYNSSGDILVGPVYWGGTGAERGFGQGQMLAVVSDTIYICGAAGTGGFLAKFNTSLVQQDNKTWSGWEATGVAVASDGSVYVVGMNDNGVIRKYNSALGLQWENKFDNSGRYDGFLGVTTSSDGNVYVAGWTGAYGSTRSDLILLKYSSGGTKLGQKNWGERDGVTEDTYDAGGGVAVTSDGIYVAGCTSAPGTDSWDALLIKYLPTDL